MKAYESVVQKLIDEFSHGTIEILVSDFASVQLARPDDQDGILNYSFEIKFNEDFRSHGTNLPEVNDEYQQYIDKERILLYDEINDIVLRGTDPHLTINTIQDYKLRFQEIQSFYNVTKRVRYQREEILISHNRYTKHKSHKSRPILEDHELRTSSTYFAIQLEALEKILAFLELKIEFLKESNADDLQPNSDRKRTLKPIESLDRFQSALLFQYLQDAGAINDLRSNKKLGSLISELTDHSANTLSKECLNQIQMIKMGEVGNKPELLKNKAHNLEQVKLVVRKMINALERDLKNNKDFQKK